MAVRAAFDCIPISSPVHNRLAVDDLAVHRWFRFVLSFPPHLVREYLTSFGANEGHTVLDPFCGTGTTLVECKKLGIKSIGIEAAPMAALASRVKIDWNVNPSSLEDVKQAVQERYEEILALDGYVDEYSKTSLIAERKTLYGFRDLDQEQEDLLLRNSISPLPLHKTLVLLQAIKDEKTEFSDHLLLGLAWSLVNEIGNVRFGPEVGVSKPKENADVIGSWVRQMDRMILDLNLVRSNASVTSHVYHSDSRDAGQILGPASVDFIITSPPYPNEKDYTRTTQLESVILGLITTKSQLRAIKKHLYGQILDLFTSKTRITFTWKVSRLSRTLRHK